MIYSVWLTGLGLLFVAAERVWPRNPEQRLLRRGILSDLAYIIFNSEYLGIILGLISIELIPILGLQHLQIGLLSKAGFWTQFVAFFLIFDFLQWCIHNLLHRVSWLWQFHKVHHSIKELDWIGNWRFHWFEIVVYRSLLYVPAALFGFRGDVMFWAGIVNTLVGHFAHANMSWHVGWLKYVINSPEMHAWHHNHPDCGPMNRNFALTLSVWDWIFGTAHVPAHDPERLGFEGIENYPEQLPGQFIEPFRDLARR
ncbi:MAG: sterol desaturase family protein [Acidimicrobiia bacterium]|nr:sterol desaturase family protein [Acidimicrobiia bacterium]